MSEHSLKEKTAKGLLWGGISNGGQQLLNLVFGIFLARLLLPEDYGLVGMLVIFQQLAAALQEGGFIAALNRKEQALQEDYNAVFWFNVACGVGAYALLFFAAPLIAAYYRQPELVPLSRVAFLGFVFSCFGTTPRAYLFRHLKVKEMAWMSLSALTLSGVVGILLAWNGFAYWGLVGQNLTYCFCTTLFAWIFSGWRPSLRVDYRPLRGMIGFASKLLATNVFTIINNNLFTVYLGGLYSDRTVGFYNQANKWTTIGHSTLSGMLWSVTQPVFARINDDEAQFVRAFRKMLRFTAFTSFPCMLGLAVIAPEFIVIALGEKWLSSALLMQILCLGGAFVPLSALYTHVLISRGKSNAYFYGTVAFCLTQGLSLFVFHAYGVEVMLMAYSAITALWCIVWHILLRRLIKISFRRVLLDVLPFLFIAAASMGAAWAASLWLESIYAALAVKVFVAVVLYLGTLKLLSAAILDECVFFLLHRQRNKA